MAVKILHTADWQIGKVFADLDELDGDKAAELRNQRLRTVEHIAATAAENEVDAVVVAGDVFDSNGVSDLTLRRTLNAMAGYRGDWLLLPGNHDAALAESAWTRLSRLSPPPNVRLLTRPEPVLVAEHRLAILPAPLIRRHEADDTTAAMDQMLTPPQAVRVGVAHGSIKGRLPERSEALNEIAEDRAERAGLDYLALGDWHGTLPIAPRTWYAGTPEPDRFKDNKAGNVLLVTIDAPGAAPQVREIPVGRFQWQRLQARLHGPADLDALSAQLASLGAPFDRHVVHLEVSGVVDLATRQALDQLLEDWRARFHVLRLRLDGLLAQPSDADLESIDTRGFVGTAVQLLRQQAGDERLGLADRERARRALEILYAEHVRLRSAATPPGHSTVGKEVRS